jgi:Peptidase family M28
VDQFQEIAKLTGFKQRIAGTSDESAAATYLANRLGELGREAQLEAFKVRPNAAAVYALHAVLAIIASLLSVTSPLAAFVLALVVTASIVADLGGATPSLRSMTSLRQSHNVLSRETSSKPGTLVIVSRYDTGKTGALFSKHATELIGTGRQLMRQRVGALRLLVAAILCICACAAIRLFLGASLALSAVQFVSTVVLILGVALAADYAFSEPTPGANNNASGVAEALALAQRYANSLAHFDLWVLLTGADEGLVGGTKSFLKSHKRELNPENTVFLDIGPTGIGSVRYTAREGPLLSLNYHPQLLAICEAVAQTATTTTYAHSHGLRLNTWSPGYLARTKGYAAASVSCRDELNRIPYSHRIDDTLDKLHTQSLNQAHSFLAQLVETIDDSVGPQLPETRQMQASS